MSLILKKIFCCWIAILGFINLNAQPDKQTTFHYSKIQTGQSEWLLTIHVSLPPSIKIYGQDSLSDISPFTSIQFDSASRKYLIGKQLQNGHPHQVIDSTLNAKVVYFTDSVDWQQSIRVGENDSVIIKGVINYIYNQDGSYIPASDDFRFFIYPTKGDAQSRESSSPGSSLVWIFLTAFAGGLLALLTPCIYSMIPVTVSFFTKRSVDKKNGIRNALLYALSIVIIFTVLGFLITLIFGPSALNNLATNWVANIIFFLLFVTFGISFLGAFEITLPSSWMNKTDSKANASGSVGIFFMALTLVIVSFSCTGPIIGNLLVLASRGNYFGPLVGMTGFSTALALPFALFAFFPGKLNILGKAGGWLNAVKVTLGFLELALALKFLSNADLSKGWRILDRETFLSMWIVIFILLGLYLLGKLKFHHDNEMPKNDFGIPYLSVTRLLLAIITLSFAVYMVPGLWGAPLKSISAFVPPMGTQDFNASASKNTIEKEVISSGGTVVPHPVKYTSKMKIYEPEVVTKYSMEVYYDYNEALAAAKLEHKPLMLDFTGINCVNCRKIEGQVWSDPAVMKKLKENFVIVSLYVDVNNIDLQENEQYDSKALGKRVETLGDKNTDIQVSRYSANSQPFYFFADGKENSLAAEGYGYDPDVQKFIRHLDRVLKKYEASNPE